MKKQELPVEPSPTTVEIVAALAEMNRVALLSRQLSPESEEYAALDQTFSRWYCQIMYGWFIPIHLDPESNIWRLGTVFTYEQRKHARQEADDLRRQFLAGNFTAQETLDAL
jgi:hypothetical protein